jgi:hypothetical protein
MDFMDIINVPWTINTSKIMKKSIFALLIAASAIMASCGSKSTEEVTSEEVETAVEETPAEEVPQLEEIEEVVEDTTEISGN